MVAVSVIDLILGEQEAAAPCQEDQEGAWASGAYLCNKNNKKHFLITPKHPLQYLRTRRYIKDVSVL